jgi:CheY-like chemotaxis protein
MKPLTRDSIRLIHVDDDGDFAELSARGLRRAGFQQPVVHFSDGAGALLYFLKLEPNSAPHVILLDLQMPGMEGLEILHWIRQNYSERDAPVYLLTSSENPEHRRRAAVEGVTEYVIKSYAFDDLIERLDRQITTINRQISECPSQPEASIRSECALAECPLAP